MKFKQSLAGIMLSVMVLSAPAAVILSESTVAVATVIDNDFSRQQQSGNANSNNFLGNGSVSEEDKAVGDMLKGQRGFTSEQLAEASKIASPLTNIIGYLTGGVVVLITSLIFLMTALDLLYIAIPPVRGFLNTDQSGATGGYGMPGAGMGMSGGYGGYGGMRGGMGMGMGMAGGGAQQGGRRRIQWISRAAIECAEPAMQPGVGGGAMGGMGMGMMGQQQTQQVGGGGIGEYLKRRIGFMIVLAICIIVLTSSVLMDTGINLAMWFLKIMDAINNAIAVR